MKKPRPCDKTHGGAIVTGAACLSKAVALSFNAIMGMAKVNIFLISFLLNTLKYKASQRGRFSEVRNNHLLRESHDVNRSNGGSDSRIEDGPRPGLRASFLTGVSR